MQTFVPYLNFEKIAKCLDYSRLGKQRQEALGIYMILTDRLCGSSKKHLAFLKKRYENHPAVHMWRGYEHALLLYGLTMCDEWIDRNYQDTTKIKFLCELSRYQSKTVIMPDWLKNKEIRNSHKSNLLRKNKEHYSQFKWNVPDNLDYIWPVKGKK